MNATQLINEVAGKTGKSKVEIKRILDALTGTISAILEKGELVRFYFQSQCFNGTAYE